MSMPNIPDNSITREEAINILLASIGYEELGLAHIINAEGEKIQSILGTLEGQTVNDNPNLEDLLTINNSVNKTLCTIAKQTVLLSCKLSDVLEAEETPEVPAP